jgi:hypothetical protein
LGSPLLNRGFALPIPNARFDVPNAIELALIEKLGRFSIEPCSGNFVHSVDETAHEGCDWLAATVREGLQEDVLLLR